MKKFIVLTLIAFISLPSLFSQSSYEAVAGSWTGRLTTAGMSLRLVLNFTLTEADTIRATLDSPDQGAIGLPMGRVYFAGDTLVAEAPAIKGEYRGVLAHADTLKGVWTQMGRRFDMVLAKGGAPVTYDRPQEPRPPFPYREEEVVIRNTKENFDLAGTLTLPEGTGPFPAVVLITGSGQQDRNETVFGHKPFMVIADYLTRNGIAVLRYDDRAAGKSKGMLTNATSLTFAGDAQAAVDFLRQRPEIDSRKIGLAGHSEGGLIAPIVAASDKNIAFIVSLAGPGVKGYDVILQQTRDIMMASGSPEKEIESAVKTNSALYDMLLSEPDQRKMTKSAIEFYNGQLDSLGLSPEERKKRMSEFTQGIIQVNTPWFRYFIATDPAQFWSEVRCPVLALNGEKDMQVNYQQNLPAIQKALKKGGNKKVKVVALPELNHLFQHCTTGAPSEYVTISETFSPEALDIITQWIRKTVK